MKVKFSALLLFFAVSSFAVSAQTEGGNAPTAEQVAAVSPTQNIPVAEFYEGGQEAMYTFIAKELKYPPMAKRNRIMGQSIISFTLNEDGSTSNFRVVKNPGAGTGDEALRVARLLKFKAPGFSQIYSIPINFKL